MHVRDNRGDNLRLVHEEQYQLWGGLLVERGLLYLFPNTDFWGLQPKGDDAIYACRGAGPFSPQREFWCFPHTVGMAVHQTSSPYTDIGGQG